MTQRMDGLKTTKGETGRRAALLAPVLLLCATCVAAATPPPLQELAGTSRAGSGAAIAVRPANAEDAGERLPTIVFAPGSDRLTPSATRLLDGFGRSLAQDRVRLDSHAGPDHDLAARRADAIAAYLEQNFGVLRERIEVVMAGRSDDRRVLLEDAGE